MKKRLIIFALLPILVLTQSCGDKGKQEETNTTQTNNTSNLEDLGDWKVDNFVDEFKDETKKEYVSIEAKGTFSNSATTNSPLKAKFIIDDELCTFKLYEYARNHPVKGFDVLALKVKDSQNKEYTFEANIYDSGDICIVEWNPGIDVTGKSLKNILLKGGEIKFNGTVNSKYGSKSEYNFKISNADHLDKALAKISQK